MQTKIGSTDTSDLREQVRVLGDDVKELARLTRNALGQKVEAARHATSAAFARGRDSAKHYGERLGDLTRENPLKSVLVAAGVGALLGLILGRR